MGACPLPAQDPTWGPPDTPQLRSLRPGRGRQWHKEGPQDTFQGQRDRGRLFPNCDALISIVSTSWDPGLGVLMVFMSRSGAAMSRSSLAVDLLLSRRHAPRCVPGRPLAARASLSSCAPPRLSSDPFRGTQVPRLLVCPAPPPSLPAHTRNYLVRVCFMPSCIRKCGIVPCFSRRIMTDVRTC